MILLQRRHSTHSFDHHVVQSIHKGGIGHSYVGSVSSNNKEAQAQFDNHQHTAWNSQSISSSVVSGSHSVISRSKGSPFIIGVAGGTASGKTEVVKQIVGNLSSVAVIPQDSFYKNLTESEIELANHSQYNFDHPFAFDFSLLKELLISLRQGEHQVRVPMYDYVNHGVFPKENDTIIEVHIVLYVNHDIKNCI